MDEKAFKTLFQTNRNRVLEWLNEISEYDPSADANWVIQLLEVAKKYHLRIRRHEWSGHSVGEKALGSDDGWVSLEYMTQDEVDAGMIGPMP